MKIPPQNTDFLPDFLRPRSHHRSPDGMIIRESPWQVTPAAPRQAPTKEAKLGEGTG